MVGKRFTAANSTICVRRESKKRSAITASAWGRAPAIAVKALSNSSDRRTSTTGSSDICKARLASVTVLK